MDRAAPDSLDTFSTSVWTHTHKRTQKSEGVFVRSEKRGSTGEYISAKFKMQHLKQ